MLYKSAAHLLSHLCDNGMNREMESYGFSIFDGAMKESNSVANADGF
jgi:hypothetical protein